MLGSSVGSGGSNQKTDTFLVQMMLNDWLTRTGQAVLKVDGIVGSKTVEAIRGFQQAVQTGTDGRVDPNGRTIVVLVSYHLRAVQADIFRGPMGKDLLNFAKMYDAASQTPSVSASQASNYLTYLKSLMK